MSEEQKPNPCGRNSRNTSGERPRDIAKDLLAKSIEYLDHENSFSEDGELFAPVYRSLTMNELLSDKGIAWSLRGEFTGDYQSIEKLRSLSRLLNRLVKTGKGNKEDFSEAKEALVEIIEFFRDQEFLYKQGIRPDVIQRLVNFERNLGGWPKCRIALSAITPNEIDLHQTENLKFYQYFKEAGVCVTMVARYIDKIIEAYDNEIGKSLRGR